MNRQDHRDVVIQFSQNAAEMRIPGVAMDNVCVDPRRVKGRATTDRTKNRIQIFGRTEARRIDAKSFDLQMRQVDFLIPKTAYLDIHDLCQFTAQVIDVNTCAPINVWGVLVRQKEGFHCGIKDRRRSEGKFRRAEKSARRFAYLNTIGMIRIATIFATLIIGLMAGPAVSLFGSPAGSPVAAAWWAGRL